MSETIIASHRGGTHLWPENSLMAFRHTAGLPVGYVEFDVHPTRDGVLVVHHDATIDRMTDGRGAIADMDFAALRERIIIGANGETIPTLAEVVEIFKPTTVDLRLELKTGSNQQSYVGMEAAVASVLAREAMLARTLVTSFAASNLIRFRAEVAQWGAPRGLMWIVSPAVIRSAGAEGTIAAAKSLGFSDVGLHVGDVDAATLARFNDAGLITHAWAAHSLAEAKRMFELGVASFTTDRPDLALAAQAAYRAG